MSATCEEKSELQVQKMINFRAKTDKVILANQASVLKWGSLAHVIYL